MKQQTGFIWSLRIFNYILESRPYTQLSNCLPIGKASKKLRTNLLLEALTVLVHNNLGTLCLSDWPAFRIRASAVKIFLIKWVEQVCSWASCNFYSSLALRMHGLASELSALTLWLSRIRWPAPLPRHILQSLCKPKRAWSTTLVSAFEFSTRSLSFPLLRSQHLHKCDCLCTRPWELDQGSLLSPDSVCWLSNHFKSVMELPLLERELKPRASRKGILCIFPCISVVAT
jgi:hypothetical protein